MQKQRILLFSPLFRCLLLSLLFSIRSNSISASFSIIKACAAIPTTLMAAKPIIPIPETYPSISIGNLHLFLFLFLEIPEIRNDIFFQVINKFLAAPQAACLRCICHQCSHCAGIGTCQHEYRNFVFNTSVQ